MSAQALPDPLAWQAEGRCRPGGGFDPALWFPPEGHGQAASEATAKAVCHTCPVLTECLGYALQNREPYGIWAATDPNERRRMLGRRGRASNSYRL